MAFDESMSLFMKIILVIVVIAIIVGLAFTFKYKQASKGAEFQRLCFEWYKDDCDLNYIPQGLYDEGNTEDPGLCVALYPGTDSLLTCQQICNNECIASGAGE